MAKKHKQQLRLPPFAAVFNEEMLSKAYLELKPSAAKALPHFKRIAGIAHKKAGGANMIVPNTPFDFTYEEAKKLGFAPRTFSVIVEELNAKGFINIDKQGGLRGCGRSNSKYRLSNRWIDYGKPPVFDMVTRSYRNPFIARPRYPHEPE